MKVININVNNFNNFWTTWKNLIKLSKKMWLMIILKISKMYGFFLYVGNTVLEKPQGPCGQIDSCGFLSLKFYRKNTTSALRELPEKAIIFWSTNVLIIIYQALLIFLKYLIWKLINKTFKLLLSYFKIISIKLANPYIVNSILWDLNLYGRRSSN